MDDTQLNFEEKEELQEYLLMFDEADLISDIQSYSNFRNLYKNGKQAKKNQNFMRKLHKKKKQYRQTYARIKSIIINWPDIENI